MGSMLKQLLHALESTQVELQAQYSIERLREFAHHLTAARLSVGVLVAAFVPVPCVVLVVLGADLPKLKSIESGLDGQSHSFWLRALLSGLIVSISGVFQYNYISLHSLKLAFRNLMSFTLHRMEDLAPIIVTFSVDVFHALFLSCIMQGANSNRTLVVTMIIDFVQSCVSLYEVSKVLQQAETAGRILGMIETKTP